jgi:hypothetical protein
VTAARRIAMLARAVLALALIVVLAAGVPLLLVRVAGWPLPSRLPSSEQLRFALGGDIGDRFWLKLFAIVVWLAWMQLMSAFVREAVALARGRMVRVRSADAWAQHVAGRLIGAIAVAVTIVGPAPGAHGRALPLAVVDVAAPLQVAETPTLSTHVVVRGESLSSIAADELGDESAWPEIWTANRGRTFGSRVFHDPNLILPGWDLQLPTAAPQPPAPAPQPAAPTPEASTPAPEPVNPVLLPPVVITAPTTAALTTAAASAVATAVTPAAATRQPVLAGHVPAMDQLGQTSSRDSAPVWARTSGVLGASLLATGIAATLAGRRRRVLRAASSSATRPVPDPELAPLVAAVHVTSDALRMTRLELALRAMAGRLAGCGVLARPLAVRADVDGRLEIVLDREVMLETPWIAGEDQRCWVLAADIPLVALTDDARGVAPPCPALVGLGAGDDGEVYVDLEALPLLDVSSRLAGEELVRLVVTTLATTPLADELRVVVVGSALPELSGRHPVQTVPDLASAIAEVEALTAGIAAVTAGAPSTFRLRATAGHEPWDPVVVVLPSSSDDADQLTRLVELARGHRGIAVIGTDLTAASWRLARDGTSWRLDPVGWKFGPHGLTEIEMTEIGSALLQAAEELPEEERNASVACCPAPAPWSLMVRVLGPVDVVDRAGRAVAFERARSLELVVWLAQHGGTATRAGARAALWGLDISNAAFSNVVSEARRAMARHVPPPDGEDWVARTYAERLPLHPAVALDADVVAMHLNHARNLSDEAAIEELRTALALVRGAPYAGTSYVWPDAEALPSTLTLLATTVAAELAERCLAVGDVEGVFAATATGLEVLPGHEELVALRMRAHAVRGDLAAVRGEFASYEQAIASDVWAGGELAPKLVALRKELLAGLVPVAGS